MISARNTVLLRADTAEKSIVKITFPENSASHQFVFIVADLNGFPFVAVSNAHNSGTIYVTDNRGSVEKSGNVLTINAGTWATVWLFGETIYLGEAEISVE